MPRRLIRTTSAIAFSAVLVALLVAVLSVPGSVRAQAPQAVAACPVPVSEVRNGVEVCVDRGPDALYVEGESIRTCVSVNIPQITIFPPPPPPTVRLTSIVNGVERGVIFEEKLASGQRCLTRTVAPPLGQESIRADVLGDNGEPIASDSVSFRSARGPASPTALRATALDSTRVRLDWTDNAANEEGFRVYDGSTLIATLTPNSTSLTVTGLAPNSSHCFQVTAFIGDVESAAVGPACGMTPPGPTPAPTSPPTPTPTPVPAPTPPPSARYVTAGLDLSAPCIPAEGAEACDANRVSLWNGEAAAWDARGVTDPDQRFVETVVLRVRAGDPAAISSIARILGWPYVQITRLDFGTGREVVEVTNLGGGEQDLSGWTVRSPANGLIVPLPREVIQPGARCYVLTGEPGGTAGFECRVFAGTPQNPPIAPAGGIWPDDFGAIVLFADPIDVLAQQARYSSDPNRQPPPPNLRGVNLGSVALSPGDGAP